MGRLVYLTRNYKTTGNGGGKARVDVEDILDGRGAVNLGLRRTYHRNKILDFALNLGGIICLSLRVRPGDTLVLQYPIKKYYTLICRIAHLRGARVVTLVHDLGSFRRKRISVSQEIKRLSHSDVLIVANANTMAWLKEQGLKRPMVEQIAWDFLSPEKPSSATFGPTSLSFIGALSPERNGFLYALPPGLCLHLYGNGGDGAKVNASVNIHGFATPDQLIAVAAGRYGLIWYGESSREHIGYIGEYIRYCNPHKLALYMRAGKPVIIWRESGAAQFIESEGVGITVDNLDNLDTLLNNISESDYEAMRHNISRVAQRMASGAYFNDALDRALALIETK